MRTAKLMKSLSLVAVLGLGTVGCTDLTETVYDQVTTNNYYNSRSDVIHAVFRPFEHVYYCMWQVHEHEELTGDQIMCLQRDNGDWVDNNKWVKYQRHQYDDITLNEPDKGEWTTEWTQMYQGIGQANLVLDDLKTLNCDDFNISQEEWDSFNGQLRALRAFCYLRLINCYRDCIITTTADAAVNNTPEVMTPKTAEEVFKYIEDELNACLKSLPTKTGISGNGLQQGQFTKAAAAAMLVRLYLNAEKWIGTPMYTECSQMCDRIIDGEFGTYELAKTWYEPFDWDNDMSNEVIFAFCSSFAGSHHFMANTRQTVYGRGLPHNSHYYLDIVSDGARNARYAISPSYNNDNPRQLFTETPEGKEWKLGMVSQKFLKYPGDRRWKQYKNLSNNTREGMFFLEGYIPDGPPDENPTGYVSSPNGYTIYLCDQVGHFLTGAPTGVIMGSGRESKRENGDFNSGLYVVKYPFYPYDGGYYMESDFVQFRLAEIYYSKAECLLRAGQTDEAAKLLNDVRERNYENFNADIAYSPEGNVKLDMEEMLDEWGREFLFESRRRTDLIRFDRFQEEWWDKPKDTDNHYELFPLSQYQLEQNKYLKQRPGYPDITRE